MAEILVDTREQDNVYILDDFRNNGFSYAQIKLDEGDYQSSANDRVVIDLKNGIQEVQKNIAGTPKQRERFLNEVLRCRIKGKKLIVLIREPIIYNVYGVQFWRSERSKNYKKYTKVSGKYIMKVMERYTKDYGVIWRFCKHENAAQEIIKTLNYYGGNISNEYFN